MMFQITRVTLFLPNQSLAKQIGKIQRKKSKSKVKKKVKRRRSENVKCEMDINGKKIRAREWTDNLSETKNAKRKKNERVRVHVRNRMVVFFLNWRILMPLLNRIGLDYMPLVYQTMCVGMYEILSLFYATTFHCIYNWYWWRKRLEWQEFYYRGIVCAPNGVYT